MQEKLQESLFIWELQGWRDSIRQQEVFQWGGLIFVITIQLLGQFSAHLGNYALFFVPLYYFSVARSEYLIHRCGGKAKFIEDRLAYVGNETFQHYTSSFIAAFDMPLFAGVSILAKLLSPYQIQEFSWPLVCYWILLVMSGFAILIAPVLAKKHVIQYEIAWHA